MSEQKKAKRMNERSRMITEGVARAPNRSMYYAMGYKDSDFDNKPMIGVANGHSTITPCNSGLQRIADAAVAAIEAGGGNSQIFGTPTISGQGPATQPSPATSSPPPIAETPLPLPRPGRRDASAPRRHGVPLQGPPTSSR